MFNIASKLFDRLIVHNECLEFAGALDTSGYGIVWKDGKNTSAHRIVYEFFCGPIPNDACVMHSCDNPRCCNFEHLSLGTKKDNSDDMISKGRRFCFSGTNNGQARLVDDDVREIRKLYTEGFTQRNLGSMFGISHTAVGNIIRRKTWSHVQ